MGSSRNAPPSNDDIARVAVAALLEPEDHAGRTYRPTGPELLSGPQMAVILAAALGRKVRHVDMPLPMFLRALPVMGPRAGIDAAQLADVRWYYQEHKLGTWEIGAPTSDVRDVTGREPEDFAAIAARYAERPEAQRTAGNLARSLRDLTRVGLTPRPRLDKLLRDLHQPQPARPELSACSQDRAAEHRDPAAAVSAAI